LTLNQHRPTILIVDDSFIMLTRLTQMIEEETSACIIAHATNYKDGLKKVELLRPDMILLDISLPDGSGIELLRQVQKLCPHSKTIMLSNHVNDYYRNLCLSIGAMQFLDKSIDYEQIAGFVSSCSYSA
jgi:DNA-binding NarL/FixJ family response regulator